MRKPIRGINECQMLVIWLTVLTANEQTNGVPCGHVQELSRATLNSSSEIFIFSGSYFYLYDLGSEVLKQRYSMEEYYENVPFGFEGVALVSSPVLLFFTKDLTAYTYTYKEGAFKDSQYVLDNMDYRLNLETENVKISELKHTCHEGQAYVKEVTQEDKKLTVCMNSELFNCHAKPSPNNPVTKCYVNDGIGKEYPKNCRGVTTATLDNNLYLVFADDKDILLFPMDSSAKLEPKSHKRLSLATIFSCRSYAVHVVVFSLVSGIVLLAFLISTVWGIWVTRRRLENRAMADQVLTPDSTVDES